MRKFIAFFLLLVATFTWSVVALASSYQTYIIFAHELTSPTRYFDGQNIAFEASPHTYPDSGYPDAQPFDSIYTVELHRYHGWLNEDFVGKATLPRTSPGKAVWTNVGPGNYYLFFQKYKDRMVVADDNARMYNY